MKKTSVKKTSAQPQIPLKKVFVSGCYDILHAGHIQFFEDAKALGDHLTVCYASDAVLMLAKKRAPSIPEDNKRILLSSIRSIDEVVISSDLHPILDFKTHVESIRPHILAVTDDDGNIEAKRDFCKQYGIELVILPKRNSVARVSTTSILSSIKNNVKVPLRVDFAGGWLDVPKFSRKGGYIVNCAISPLVSFENWTYKKGSGLGGSAAYAILKAQQGVRTELEMGVGWQDPAVIHHTGLCIWRSGMKPVLDMQLNPEWLAGKMLIYWTGRDHLSTDHVGAKRDFKKIYEAGKMARAAAVKSDLKKLARAVTMGYRIQLEEGMEELPEIKGALASKYLGAGHGGYALYLFEKQAQRDRALAKVKDTRKIEPYLKAII